MWALEGGGEGRTGRQREKEEHCGWREQNEWRLKHGGELAWDEGHSIWWGFMGLILLGRYLMLIIVPWALFKLPVFCIYYVNILSWPRSPSYLTHTQQGWPTISMLVRLLTGFPDNPIPAAFPLGHLSLYLNLRNIFSPVWPFYQRPCSMKTATFINFVNHGVSKY